MVHTDFDSSTLERMLQYVYQGDYSVTVPAVHYEIPTPATNGNHVETLSSKAVPPHLRKSMIPIQSDEDPSAQCTKAPASNPMIAHIYVYAIAEHYELPELQILALEKFKDSNALLSLDNFALVAKAVYAFTAGSEDKLRMSLLETLFRDHVDWMHDDGFINTLADEVELHELTVFMMSAMFSHATNLKDVQQKADEEQAAANGILLSNLDKATAALAASDGRWKETEERFSKLQVQCAQQQNDSRISAFKIDRVTSDLQKATSRKQELEVELGKVRSEALKAATQVSKLECDLKSTEEFLQKTSEQEQSLSKRLKESEKNVKKEADRANSNHDLWKQQGVTLRAETARAKTNVDLCQVKDGIIKSEQARANKNYDLYRAEKARANQSCQTCVKTFNLVNNWDYCRNQGCQADFDVWLDDDDRGIGAYMLRCSECRCRHYPTE